MSEKRFCPNCGHPVKPDAAFCANCGHKLPPVKPVQPKEDPILRVIRRPEQPASNVAKPARPAATRSAASASATAAARTQASASQAGNKSANPQASSAKKPAASPRQKPTKASNQQPALSRQAAKHPVNKGKRAGVIAAIVLVVLIAFGSWYYSSSNQLNRFVSRVNNNKDISAYLVLEGSKDKVSKSEARAFEKVLSGDSSYTTDLQKSFAQGQSYEGLKWVKSGHRLLVFPAYKVQAAGASATLSTNHANTAIYRGSKKVATTTASKQSVKLTGLFPGTYTFKASGKVSGRQLSAQKQVTLAPGNTTSVGLDLKTPTFTVKGIKGSSVYLNGKKVGTLNSKGVKHFSDYPMKNGLPLYLKTTVDGKTMKSETVSVEAMIDGGTTTITPSYKGLVSKSEAKSLLNDAYTGLENGSNSSIAEDDFVGDENNDSYNELISFYEPLEDSLYDVEVTKVKSITPLGKKKAQVSYSVKFTFMTDTEKKVQQFTYNGGEIVKSGGSYKIKSIGKTGTEPDWERTYDED